MRRAVIVCALLALGLGGDVNRRLLLVAGGGAAFSPTAPVAFEVAASPRGGWSFFSGPNAYYHAGKTVFGYIDGAGDPYAVQWDHATDTLSTPARLYAPHQPFQVDDHDDPAFVRRASDGRIVAGFSTHVGSPYVNISTNPDDATAWQGVVNVASQFGAPTGDEGYSYVRLHQLTDETDDPIYFWHRFHPDQPAPPSPVYLSYSKSTDGGATWGSRVDVVNVAYHQVTQNGNGRLDFLLSDHPFYFADSSIYHMYYEGGNFYKSDGTQITAAQPFELSDTTLVYDGTTARAWVWDIAADGTGKPVAVYVVYEEPYPSGAWHYEYARWTGSAWETHEVADAGTTIATGVGGSTDYAGGIAIDHQDTNRVWLSRPVSGSWETFEYVTSDGGATWAETQLTFGSGSVKNVRPTCVIGHNGELAVLWMRGTYSTYVSYSVGTWGIGT